MVSIRNRWRKRQPSGSGGGANGQSRIKTLALETFACANRNHMGRVAAFRQRDAISDLFAHTDVIFLVTGLGRKTGSSALPVMAKLARQAGALVIAPVITPFKFEGKESQQIADAAINHLKREADLVVEFQNEQLMVHGGETLTQSDAFALQNLGIAMCIRSLMDFVSSAEFA